MKPKPFQNRIPLGWKISLFAGLAVSALLVLSGHLYKGGSPEPLGLLLIGIFGFTIGAIQGPVFDPDSFRFPALWQGGFGATGAVAVTVLLGLSPEAIVLGSLAGFFLSLLGMQLLRILDHL